MAKGIAKGENGNSLVAIEGGGGEGETNSSEVTPDQEIGLSAA